MIYLKSNTAGFLDTFRGGLLYKCFSEPLKQFRATIDKIERELSLKMPISTHTPQQQEKQQQQQLGWRKVLYGQTHGYPDNYTPRHSFLAAIQRNKNLKVKI